MNVSEVNFKKHRVFRETDSVIFYDISVENSNASDLVVHTGPAISPPNDIVGAKQFYIHRHQTDNNRVLSGVRTFELINAEWKYPYHIIHLNRSSGALVIPTNTYHRSISGKDGSIVIITKQLETMNLMLILNLFLYLQHVINKYMIFYLMKSL